MFLVFFGPSPELWKQFRIVFMRCATSEIKNRGLWSGEQKLIVSKTTPDAVTDIGLCIAIKARLTEQPSLITARTQIPALSNREMISQVLWYNISFVSWLTGYEATTILSLDVSPFTIYAKILFAIGSFASVSLPLT